jgi:drug/metabolite transporter (DMT)-like permease
MAVSDAAASPSIMQKAQANPLMTAYWVLLGVVGLDTFATSLARLTLNSGMPPLAIVGLRMTLAWIILTPVVLWKYRPELREVSRNDRVRTMGAGVGLMLHLLLGFFALENTSIMIVHVMFSTSLFWVAMLERLFLKVKFPRLVLIGLVLAFAGSMVIALTGEEAHPLDDFRPEQAVLAVFADVVERDTSLWGIIAAISSAAAGAVYMVIGRKARENMASIPYIWGLYGTGTVVGLSVVGLTNTSITGYSLEAYFWLLLLLLVAQLGIHGGLNYVMGQLSATFVGIAGQVPTVTATIVAVILFSEVPHEMEVVGGAVIMVGVLVAIWGQRTQTDEE